MKILAFFVLGLGLNNSAVADNSTAIIKNVQAVCQSPSQQDSHWQVRKKEANGDIHLAIIGMNAEVTFTKSEWESVQQLLKSQPQTKNPQYQTCESRLSALFLNKQALENARIKAENDKMLAGFARHSLISGIVDIVIGPVTAVFTQRSEPPLAQKLAGIYLNLSRLAYLENNKQEALQYCYRATQADPENSRNWEQLSDLLEKAGDFGTTQQDKTEIAVAYKRLGEFQLAHYTPGNPEKVLQFYQKVEKLDKSLVTQEEIAALYSRIADGFDNFGELNKAQTFHQQAIKLHQATGDKKAIVDEYIRSGNAYMTLTNDIPRNNPKVYEMMDKALAFYQQALSVSESSGSKENLAQTYHALGSFYLQSGYAHDHFETGIEYHQKSIELYQAIGNKPGLAKNYGALAVLYEALGDTEKTKFYEQKTLEFLNR